MEDKKGSPQTPNGSTKSSSRGCDKYFWIKYSLFAVNFLVWVGGICLIVIGVWSRVTKGYLNAIDIAIMTDPALFLVAVGVIMFVISVFGCLGSVKEHTLLLKIFCVVVILVFILQAIAGIMAFVFIDHVEPRIITYMTTSIQTYREDSARRETLDYIHKRFQCCGSSSYADWELNKHYNCSSSSNLKCSVPISCCIQRNSVICAMDTRKKGESYASKHIYTQGCTSFLMSLYMDNLIIVGAIAFAVCFLELVAVVLAHMLITYVIYSRLRPVPRSVLARPTKQPVAKTKSRPEAQNYPSTTVDKDAQLTRL